MDALYSIDPENDGSDGCTIIAQNMDYTSADLEAMVDGFPAADWTIVNKKDTIFKYIFWERLDSLPIPECCFHFIWCQIA